MGWITPAIQSLQKRIAARLKISSTFLGIQAAIFDNFIIKTIPSDAESCEIQDGGKQYYVGQTTAKLQVVFHLDVVENVEKKMKIKF